jgi:hypothetical protein
MKTTTIENVQVNPGLDGPLPGWNDNPNGSNDPEPAEGGSPALPAFLRAPGETPRAFSAFMTWFQLGRARSHAALADKLGESLGTVKNWSSKYAWAERLHTYQAGLLQEQARQHAAIQLQQAADWTRRLADLREQEWEAAQKLNSVAQCYLETCGEDEVRQMTLAEVSRALKVSSSVARSAITGAELPASSETGMSPLQQQLLAGLTRVYGQAETNTPAPAPVNQP